MLFFVYRTRAIKGRGFYSKINYHKCASINRSITFHMICEGAAPFVVAVMVSDVKKLPNELNIFLFHQAIWKTKSVSGQTQIIWQDPKNQGWKPHVSYRFNLKHRPKTGVINLQIYEGAKKIIDSGDVIDRGLSGGRVGVFTCSQVNHTFKIEYVYP